MVDLPEWMSNTEYLVLLALDSSDIVQIYTPTVLAENLPAERETIQRILSDFESRDLVIRVSRGKYRISKTGRTFIDGELCASELEADDQS